MAHPLNFSPINTQSYENFSESLSKGPRKKLFVDDANELQKKKNFLKTPPSQCFLRRSLVEETATPPDTYKLKTDCPTAPGKLFPRQGYGSNTKEIGNTTPTLPSKMTSKSITVLRYRTNFNPYSPERDQPVGTGQEIQIPTEKEATYIPRYVSDFDPQCEIGKGSFGCVVLCINRTDGWSYAIKKLSYSNQKLREKFLQETFALAALEQHPHIVRYYSSWEDPVVGSIYIQLEWCKGGSLNHQLINNNYVFKQTDICKIVRHVCLALQFIHANGFSHSDVKPDNILVSTRYINDDTVFKVGDLGQLNGSGDGKYLAPEVLKNEDVTSLSLDQLIKADVFSLGITIYELAKGGRNNLPNIISSADIQLPDFQIEFVNILKVMIDIRSSQRPLPSQLVVHPLFQVDPSMQLLCEREENSALKRKIQELENMLESCRENCVKRHKKFDLRSLRENLSHSTGNLFDQTYSPIQSPCNSSIDSEIVETTISSPVFRRDSLFSPVSLSDFGSHSSSPMPSAFIPHSPYSPTFSSGTITPPSPTTPSRNFLYKPTSSPSKS